MAEDRAFWKWAVPIGLLLLIAVSFIGYQWVVPRTRLDLRTVYHEQPGGGGTGGLINVNILMTNQGNRQIEDLTCQVIILVQSGDEVARGMTESLSFGTRENAELKVSFVGSQYYTYTLSIHVRFQSSGNTILRDLSHSTEEDSMNIVFLDTLR